jgi:ActR/RegA family two-component response regulator
MPEDTAGLGRDTLFVSGDGRSFHQLRVAAESPKALLTATPRFIPMVFATEGMGMRLLCNLPNDDARIVDLIASPARQGELLKDAAFYLFSNDEGAPPIQGALRDWWSVNVETPAPDRGAIDAGALVEFVHNLGHFLNNANAVIAANAEAAVDDDEAAGQGLRDILDASRSIGRLMHRLQQRYRRGSDAVPDPLGVLSEHERQERILREWAHAETKPASPVTDSSAASQASLLVIEDDEDLGDITVLSLQAHGFPGVRLVRTPGEAMAVFEETPALMAVLSDFNLEADRTGLDLVREMRRRRPGLQALIVSGQADQVQGLMTAEEQSDIEVLRKPPDEEYLEERLRRLLKQI